MENVAQLEKIGFGGSCHWCTEAIFCSLIGVSKVDQGWIASKAANDSYSEGVFVQFDPAVITMEILIEIHLFSHSCTSKHSMRGKYRSAIYTTLACQTKAAGETIKKMQENFERPIITQVLAFEAFRLNEEKYLDYYQKNPDKPFCSTYISPKLNLLREHYSAYIKPF